MAIAWLKQKIRGQNSKFIDCVSLYSKGVKSVWDFKWYIINLMLSFITSSTTLYLNNQLILDEKAVTFYFLMAYIASIGVTIVNKNIQTYVNYKLANEDHEICKNIRQFINHKFTTASYKWKAKYTHTERFEMIWDIYDLSRVLYAVFSIINKIVEFITIILLSLSVSYHLFIAILIYVCANILQTKFSKLLSNQEWSDKIKYLKNKGYIQCTNQQDIDYSHGISKLLSVEQYDISIGAYNYEMYLANARRKHNTTDLASNIVLFASQSLIATYLYYTGIPTYIIFFILNKNSITNILTIRFDLKYYDNNADFDKLLTMINDIDALNPIETYKPHSHELFLTKNYTLNITNMHYVVSDTISLEYIGNIQISSDDRIVLLNGEKGSGKSVTADILGGRYDDLITSGMSCNLIALQNEFRDMHEYIFYMRQCIMEDYRYNDKSTIIMPLCELFPTGTLHTIEKFLEEFKIAHKMPKTLDEPLSTTERGLSPGEMQSFLFASQFWKAKLLQPRIIIMDEPERNVDLSVMFKAMKTILDDFNGVIILITHSSDVKRYLLPNITQMWNYRDVRTDEKRILTFDIIHDKTQMLEKINSTTNMSDD